MLVVILVYLALIAPSEKVCIRHLKSGTLGRTALYDVLSLYTHAHTHTYTHTPHTHTHTCTCTHAHAPTHTQFLKDLTLQLRAIGTNLCQLLTPVIFICFAGIMQLIINNILSANGTAIPGSNAFPIPVNPGRLEACTKNSTTNNPEKCHDEIFNFFVEFPNWAYNLSHIE